MAMILHHLVLLLLCWPCGRVNAESQDDLAFDQIATASENVPQTVKKPDQNRTNVPEQPISSSIETTVRYENSNGFVPMTTSSSRQNRHSRQRVNFVPPEMNRRHRVTNSTRTGNSLHGHKESGKLEDNLAYSTEARAFLNLPQFGTNRRSFDSQDGQNEFELLKVTNDTPAIANYQDFFENVQSNINSENDHEHQSRTLARHKMRTKAKRVENYMANYGVDNDKNVVYPQYYQRGSEDQKNAYDAEKVASNYDLQETMNYNGHGPIAAEQPGTTISSLPRTNHNANELPGKTLTNLEQNNNENYDNVAAPSAIAKTRYRLSSKPVVVFDPNHYKVDMKFGQARSSTPMPYTMKNLESSRGDSGNHYEIYNRDDRNRSFDRDDDSIETSESTDYSEYTEPPKRMQKARRRPYSSDNSRRLPKEHRGVSEDMMDLGDQRKRPIMSRPKSHRQRTKGNAWSDDDRGHSQQESIEEQSYDNRNVNHLTETKNARNHRPRMKSTNSWSQLSPNIEISHSNGIEIDSMQKPKILVPVKVNLVPVTNFDHATALDNSQGFDVSNAVLQSFVTASPINTLTTVAPLLSTSQPMTQKQSQNTRNMGFSTPVPDIIVGQNSLQSQMQTVLLPQTNVNKLAQGLKPQYLPTTMAPIFAVTPTLQSLPIQNAITPRPTYPATTAASNLQQLAVGQMQPGVPHLLLPQPTVQTIANLLPVQTNSEYKIQVNPHGLHGQNLIAPGSLQVQPSTTTVQPQTVTRLNLVAAESQNKKYPMASNPGNFLATASLAVGQNTPKNVDYYLQNTDQFKPHLQEGLYQMLKDIDLSAKTKTYMMPVLQSHVTNHQNVHDSDLNRGPFLLKNKLPSLTFQAFDSVGSHSSSNANSINAILGTSDNAHLPHVGTKNVQIMNPNIKPSPIDTTPLDAYGNVQQYPAAVLTTPIPIYSTTGFVTPLSVRPAVLSPTSDNTNLQNFVDSLTEIGTKTNQATMSDLKAAQNQERPIFNPINFVPNIDVLKNQNALNSKNQGNEPLQQSLNLVPLVPGGNFFKPSFSAQSELVTKPKLLSDLEKYAEQMFRESLKTIYNSQKWNNDRRVHANNSSISDTSDLSKLRHELQKLKTSMSDSKRNKEILEAHHSENQIRTAEPNRPSNSGSDRKPDQVLLATLEHLLKTHPQEPIHIYHGGNDKHNHGHGRPSDHSQHFASHQNFKHDFRTTKTRNFPPPPPPKGNMYHHKSHFHDKPKKRPRPGSSRYHGHGSKHRQSRPSGPEAAASNNFPVHMTPPRFENFHTPSFDRDLESEFDHSYPSFTTTASPLSYSNPFKEKLQDIKDHSNFNHPRVHNLLGLLMKNKQLPSGTMASYFRDKDNLKQYFEEERQRLQQQLYDETLRSYMQKSDGTARVNSRPLQGHPLSDP